MTLKNILKYLSYSMVFLFIFQNHSSAKTTVLKYISAQKCLDSFLNRIHLDGKIKTNPGSFTKVLDQDFYLSDFSEKDRIFHNYLTKPQDISPLISSIKNAILNRHPAIQEVICKIEEKKLIQNIGKPDLKVINNTIYRILILDIIIKEMVNDVYLMRNIKTHYLKTRYKLLPQESSIWSTYKAAGSVFETAKLLTMDKVIDQYYSFMNKEKLDKQDLKNKSFGLRTNIMEATLADTFKFNFANAYAGKTLIANHIQEIHRDKNIIKQVFSDGWSPLYETWNLAFVTANLNNLHIILPKLLIPSVIGTSDDEYLFYRGLSLWITINLYLFHKIEKKQSIDLPDKIKTPLTKMWGEINKKHAVKMDNKPFSFILPYGLHLGWEVLTSKISS